MRDVFKALNKMSACSTVSVRNRTVWMNCQNYRHHQVWSMIITS